jgi:membrane fusion protein (multidrug efflux system)
MTTNNNSENSDSMDRSNTDGEPAAPPVRRSSVRRMAAMAVTAAVLLALLVVYLAGGRYVRVDNAYVRAPKVLVSTDVSGVVSKIEVHEGQTVTAGQVLFRLDAHPFELALANAQASLQQVKEQIESAKAKYRSDTAHMAAQAAQVQYARVVHERNAVLAKSGVIARIELEQADSALQAAVATNSALTEDARATLVALNGNPELPYWKSAAYQREKAVVDEASRRLERSVVRAPFNGTVTDVDAIQPGSVINGSAQGALSANRFGLISSESMWIEARVKETDLTYIASGSAVRIRVDTFPGCEWPGRVTSVSAASDSTFSLLPSETMVANWVKVIQRIPLRIEIDFGAASSDCRGPLRVGMSAVVGIDTRHSRWSRLKSALTTWY